MAETELVQGRREADPATKSAGLTYETVQIHPNKNDYPIHQIQQDFGVNWIVIDDDIVHNETNVYYKQIRQPNGDIYLKQVDIFERKSNRPQVSQQAGDQG